MKYQYEVTLYRFALGSRLFKQCVILCLNSETIRANFKDLISDDNFSKEFLPISIKDHDVSFQHNYKIYSVIKIPVSKDTEVKKCISI